MTYLGLYPSRDYKIEKNIKIGQLEKKLFSKFHIKIHIFVRTSM